MAQVSSQRLHGQALQMIKVRPIGNERGVSKVFVVHPTSKRWNNKFWLCLFVA